MGEFTKRMYATKKQTAIPYKDWVAIEVMAYKLPPASMKIAKTGKIATVDHLNNLATLYQENGIHACKEYADSMTQKYNESLKNKKTVSYKKMHWRQRWWIKIINFITGHK